MIEDNERPITLLIQPVDSTDFHPTADPVKVDKDNPLNKLGRFNLGCIAGDYDAAVDNLRQVAIIRLPTCTKVTRVEGLGTTIEPRIVLKGIIVSIPPNESAVIIDLNKNPTRVFRCAVTY